MRVSQMTQFTLTSVEDDIECTLKFEAVYLDDVCIRIAQFLNGSGYTYVEGLEVIKRSDK